MKNKLEDNNVVVIGTGPGGSAIAALLANDGAKPVVLERNTFVGGKAGSIDVKGSKVEVGLHLSARGPNGELNHLAKKVNVDVKWANYHNFFTIGYKGKSVTLPPNFGSPKHLVKLLRIIKPSVFGIPGAIRFFLLLNSIRAEEDLGPYYGMSALELIRKYTSDEDIVSILSLFCMWAHADFPEDVAASSFLWAASHWIRDGSTSYPVGGFGRLFDSYLDVCRQQGGSVRLEEGVEKIVIENNRVVGVETKNGFIPADIVVSNAGVKMTVRLAGKDNFSPSYVKQTIEYEESLGAVAVQYGLDYKPTNELLALHLPDRLRSKKYYFDQLNRGDRDLKGFPVAWACPTLADPGLAPDGQHIFLAGTLAPYSMLDNDKNSELLDYVEKGVKEHFPDIDSHAIWKRRRSVKFYGEVGGRGTGEVLGWGMHVGQEGAGKTSARTTVEGLYVVGADTCFGGIGMEACVDSALRTHNMIMEDISQAASPPVSVPLPLPSLKGP